MLKPRSVAVLFVVFFQSGVTGQDCFYYNGDKLCPSPPQRDPCGDVACDGVCPKGANGSNRIYVQWPFPEEDEETMVPWLGEELIENDGEDGYGRIERGDFTCFTVYSCTCKQLFLVGTTGGAVKNCVRGTWIFDEEVVIEELDYEWPCENIDLEQDDTGGDGTMDEDEAGSAGDGGYE